MSASDIDQQNIDPQNIDPHNHPEPSALGRRRLVAGAVAAVAAAVVIDQRAEPAAAIDPNDVVLGAANTTTTTTTISNTAVGGTGLVLHADGGGSGEGLFATGTFRGVLGVGQVGVFGRGADVNGGVGVQADAFIGVDSGSSAVGGIAVRGVAAFGTALVGLAGQPQGNPGDKQRIGVLGLGGDGALGAMLGGQRAPVRLLPAATPGPPALGAHEVGELVVDSTGALFYCNVSGAPGTWVQLDLPQPTPQPIVVSQFQTLPTPERFVDTRINLGGVRGPVPAQTTHTFQMTGRTGQSGNAALVVPDSATSLLGNVTAIGADGVSLGSFITVWPSGPQPTVSNVNFGPANVTGAIANTFVVGLAASAGHGNISVYNHSACDYILDVTGYSFPQTIPG